VVSRRVVVDYEELHRMAHVWGRAARALAYQAMCVAASAAEPPLIGGAALDPLGAARAERAIAVAAGGPHGLSALSVAIAADGLALDGVVRTEQLVDDLPAADVGRLAAWLLTAPIELPFAPRRTLRAGRRDVIDLAEAAIGYLAPFTEPLLSRLAPSPTFRADVAMRRNVRVDPILGLPLAAVAGLAPEGPGHVSMSRYQPAWAGSAPGSLAGAMSRIADLEDAPDASLAVERVTGRDGRRRYVVELPGMRHLGTSADPLDLSGAVSAMEFRDTAYTRCVRSALDAAKVPPGADVMLVGHSQGGIVAMDLAGDPSFNGGRVHVTQVVAAGSPISAMRAVGKTRVFSVENVNDVVTHLDAIDSAARPQSVDRLTYQFAADLHDVVGTHDPRRYAAALAALDGSSNPLYRDMSTGIAPYLSGSTVTTIFTLADTPGIRTPS
jgi:hypothetical protein